MPELQINFLAVGVAAFTTIVIGAVWYSPLMFQKVWMRAHGYSADKIAELQASAGRTFLVSFLCYVVMAIPPPSNCTLSSRKERPVHKRL